MRDMPFLIEAVPLSLQFTSVETIFNVAGVGAIFPWAVLVDAKGFSAMSADDLPITTMLDQFWVGIPPFRSASIGAEDSAFLSGSLNQGSSAAFTHISHTTRLFCNLTA